MERTSIVMVLKTDVKLHHYCAAIGCKGAKSDVKILHRVAQEAKPQPKPQPDILTASTVSISQQAANVCAANGH